MFESISAPKETVSVAALPKVRLPLIVALPVTVKLPETATSLVTFKLPVGISTRPSFLILNNEDPPEFLAIKA